MATSVTIVIPMHNASRYLSQCLDSVVNQTLREIEVVCVDDCSTDNTLDIAREYAERDARIRIIALEENKGPSAARNEGMHHAEGEYIGFVDSDDWIDADYFGRMLSIAKNHDADYVVNTSFLRECPNHSKPMVWLPIDYPAEGMEVDRAFCANNLNCMPMARLIARSLIESCELSFPLQFRLHEDDFFHRISCIKARKTIVCKGGTYHYRDTEGSITNTSSQPCRQYLRMFQALKNHCKDSVLRSDFRLKLYNKMLFSQISATDYDDIKSYVEDLQPYLNESGVVCSDFDSYVINHVKDSTSYDDLMNRIGQDPWVRYNTLQRIKNKMKVKISVIIPIYNTERYLHRCLESVCHQTLRDIEIICVNDASTDNSLSIAKQFAFEDNRVNIINMPDNRGVAMARNEGMKAAHGEHVYFIDSDDWIDNTYLETMLRTIEQQGVDVIVNTRFINEYDDTAKNRQSNFSFFDKKGEVIAASTVERLFPPIIWAHLYRRSFLKDNGIAFPDIRLGEDVFFAYACDLSAGTVFIFEGDCYHYYQRPASAMHTASRGYYYIENFRLLYRFLCNKGISTEGVKLFYVESLIIDSAEKYNLIREYLNEIRQLIEANQSLYNAQELFLLHIITETNDFDEFRKKYNPNISLAFLRHRMVSNVKK